MEGIVFGLTNSYFGEGEDMTPREHAALRRKYKFKPAWIGVDLDCCLAKAVGWRGYDYIGDPIPAMLKRVKRWLKQGRKVKIFTARVEAGPQAVKTIHAWCKKHGLGRLEVTNVKDSGLVELWDDLAVRVGENTGKTCCRYNPNWKVRIVYGR